jgi:hypothetical protein
MSFRLFIYYCAVCGAWAALLGWALTQPLYALDADSDLRTIVRGACVGILVALGLSLVDAIWNGALSQAAKLLARVGVAVGIALVGCLIGAGLGQGLLHLAAKFTDSELIRSLAAIPGWTVTGLLIGASLGIYDIAAALAAQGGMRGALRKIINGVLGGMLGGLLGGILYLLLGVALPKVFGRSEDQRLLSSAAVGLVVLGACIGLAIGLAQIILKEAWLRVEAGFRPGREMILSKAETTIGRAESCDLGLFGDHSVERTHARILHEGSRYVLADAGTPGGTFLNDGPVTEPTPLRSGDAIRVGKSVLRFGERQKRNSR